MQIDIDDKEARVLLNALRMYRAHIQDQAEARAVLDKKQADKPKGCCCFDDLPAKIPYYKDDNFCAGLRDKLKQHQMKFPLEEHDIYRRYGYDKTIGYTLKAVGLPPDVEP